MPSPSLSPWQPPPLTTGQRFWFSLPIAPTAHDPPMLLTAMEEDPHQERLDRLQHQRLSGTCWRGAGIVTASGARLYLARASPAVLPPLMARVRAAIDAAPRWRMLRSTVLICVDDSGIVTSTSQAALPRGAPSSAAAAAVAAALSPGERAWACFLGDALLLAPVHRDPSGARFRQQVAARSPHATPPIHGVLHCERRGWRLSTPRPLCRWPAQLADWLERHSSAHPPLGALRAMRLVQVSSGARLALGVLPPAGQQRAAPETDSRAVA